MFLRILVLVAALAQVPVAVYLGAGSFEGVTQALPVFIQPAGWAFAIWGLIYALSIVFAVYQVIPKYDNQTLRAVRIPALIAFIGSSVWLLFANSVTTLIWFSIPTLFIMGGVLAYVVTVPRLPAQWPQLFSQSILFPYAAWAGIAQWLNAQALLNEQGIITSESINLFSNLGFLLCIVVFSFYFFYRSGWSVWYGGVIVWASIGIISTNVAGGSIIIAVFAGVLALAALASIRRAI